jgi:hypothetical protein
MPCAVADVVSASTSSRSTRADDRRFQPVLCAFSAEQDFLTYMNNTNDPAAQLKNAQFLRSHLAGDPWPAPMKLTHLNPADATGPPSAAFAGAKTALMGDLDRMIANRSVAFPPVRAVSKETIPGSMSNTGWLGGATRSGPTLGKLAQHQISNVVGTAGNVWRHLKAQGANPPPPAGM